MITFGEASLVAAGPVKLIATHAPGFRILSLITEGAQCRDKADSTSRYTAVSFDIDIELGGTGTEDISIDVRGGDALLGKHAFGVLRLQIGNMRRTLTGGQENGEIYDRIVLPVAAPSTLRLSVLLLANAGAEVGGESLVALDTLDLAFAA